MLFKSRFLGVSTVYTFSIMGRNNKGGIVDAICKIERREDVFTAYVEAERETHTEMEEVAVSDSFDSAFLKIADHFDLYGQFISLGLPMDKSLKKPAAPHPVVTSIHNRKHIHERHITP